MNDYIVIGRVGRVPAGSLVSLSAEQARRRAHLLTETDDAGVYLANAPLVFKNTEEFGCDQVLTKQQLDSVAYTGDNEDGPAVPVPVDLTPAGNGDDGYGDMSRDELLAECDARGLEYKAKDTMPMLIELLDADDLTGGD